MNVDFQTITAPLISLTEAFQANPLGAAFVLGLAAIAACYAYFSKDRD